ncbi:hypothetical protein GCM10023159_20980 [Brevibacterium yomogidense]
MLCQLSYIRERGTLYPVPAGTEDTPPHDVSHVHMVVAFARQWSCHTCSAATTVTPVTQILHAGTQGQHAGSQGQYAGVRYPGRRYGPPPDRVPLTPAGAAR